VARSDDLLDKMDFNRDIVKHEKLKVRLARTGLALGIAFLSMAVTLGPAGLLPEAAAFVMGVVGALLTIWSAGMTCHYIFSQDWEMNKRKISHSIYVSQLERHINELSREYTAALNREMGN